MLVKSPINKIFTAARAYTNGRDVSSLDPVPLHRVIHELLHTQFRQQRMRRCAVGCLFPVLPPGTSEFKRTCSFSMNFDRAAKPWRSIDTFYMLH